MNPLRDYELEHIARLLMVASNQFSNHGCNDYETAPTETNKDLARALWRSDGEDEADIEHRLKGKSIFLQDFVLMRFLAERCREAIEYPATCKEQVGVDMN